MLAPDKSTRDVVKTKLRKKARQYHARVRRHAKRVSAGDPWDSEDGDFEDCRVETAMWVKP